jgi:hypothetical protein
VLISILIVFCQPYLHESRHKHAMRRPRGPGGRFLTAEEIAAQQKAAESSDPSSFNPNPNPSAEERKAMKASESAAASGLDGVQAHEASFSSLSNVLAGNSEPSAGTGTEFHPFTNATSSAASNTGQDTPSGYTTAGHPQSSAGAHVQFSALSAGPPSGPGL